MKAIEDNFTDWEADTFGFGYGTGEEHTLKVLKVFLALCCRDQFQHAYDHDELSGALTGAVAWLLINVLCHAGILEYGTSPRYGWLTKQGEALKAFVCERTDEQLYELTAKDSEYIHCYPDHCNCDDGDCRPSNPFWQKRS